MMRPLEKSVFEGGRIIANTRPIIIIAEENCVNIKVYTVLFWNN